MAPAKGTTKAPTTQDFRGSIAWLSGSLSTFRGVGYPSPRKTRFQVLVRLSWAGFHPQGSDKRFSTHLMFVVLLFQASWHNPPFSARSRRGGRGKGDWLRGTGCLGSGSNIAATVRVLLFPVADKVAEKGENGGTGTVAASRFPSAGRDQGDGASSPSAHPTDGYDQECPSAIRPKPPEHHPNRRLFAVGRALCYHTGQHRVPSQLSSRLLDRIQRSFEHERHRTT